MVFFNEYFLNKGGGFGSPKLYVKFWWPLFLALKTRLFFAKSDKKSPLNVPMVGGGGMVAGLGLSPKFYHFFWLASLNRKYSFTAYCAYL